jgi:hypothetical protein
MFTFRGMTDNAERIKQRIRKVVGSRHAIHGGELQMRVGMDRRAVQLELDAMLERGEVERLRPIDYPGEDLDFFRVNRPVASAIGSADRRVSQGVRNGHEHVRLAGEVTAWLED